ncbi:hypothetical protein DB30_01714 [Enhygromyxa salina]|uniref:Uncharacterized protein n=1 Tax=Enhygromyxa salina TaxID=215803 RepID=A0A0C2D9F3_9BACT|nr:hypothetical protein [Enhygromyxa salina]KIG18210.1 hypothetical protein DB30_01714 [Enhygromyxa salina]
MSALLWASLVGALPAGVWAGPPAPSGDSIGEAGSDEPGESAPMLLLAADESELGAASLRAVRVELNDVEVTLERIDLDPAWDLPTKIAAGEALVRARAAVGLVWLEPRPDGLTIHLVVGDGGVLLRPVLGFDDRLAAIEAAAVIIRHLTTDLIAGRPIGLTRASAGTERGDAREVKVDLDRADPVEPPDVAPPPPLTPTQQLRARGHVRLQAAYIGQAWARERAWDSGAELSLGWRSAPGAHVGAGVALIPRFERTVSHPTVSGVMTYRVARYPISLIAGYQHAWARSGVALDAQLRVVAELHQRRATDPIGDISLLFGGSKLRAIPAIEPRVQLDYVPLAQLSLFVALGLRVGLVDTRYSVSYADELGQPLGETVVLQPNLVSPVVAVGLAVYL